MLALLTSHGMLALLKLTTLKLHAGYARILVTTSVESQIAAPGYLPYTASKWALMALQEEWYSSHVSTNHSTNIDFVTILPGTVNTSLGYHISYGER